MLPVPISKASREEKGGSSPTLRPELEFIFRTLVELRVDMDELRREFEAYRSGASVDLGPYPMMGRVGSGGGSGIEIGAYPPEEEEGGEELVVPRTVPDDARFIVFEPGMTMEDIERQAIVAALEEMGGNRRKAADLLGIGERTLYRKISKYDLEA